MNKEKAWLRAEIRSRTAEMDDLIRKEIDEQIVSALLRHPVYQNSRRIFLYVSVRNEIHTHSLIETAVGQGKIVALPKSGPNGIMTFYRYDGNLTEGKYGIPEPMTGERMEPDKDDLLIVPGLAFDRRGYRLGLGGGYYDRYMADHDCLTIGLCREATLLQEVPVLWNDLPVDYVITESSVYGK